jgi:cation diffusion facilitator family transporter
LRDGSSVERQVQWAAWGGAALNVLLAAVKGLVGWMSGSRALVADAVHSAADVVASLAVIVGLRIAKKPPDQDHPYGHGKAEMISSALVGILLVGAAVEVVTDGIRGLFSPPPEPKVAAAATAFAAIVFKEAMFRYSYHLGRRLNSRSLVASAYDHRSDVISSTAALTGIVLAVVGASVHVHVLLYADAVASILVGLLVAKMGYEVVRDASNALMDTVVNEQDMIRYRDFIEAIEGVARIDELRVRDHGRYVIIDVKIGVDADISVAAGHEIAAEVKRRIMAAFPNVLDVFVHVNPYYPEGADSE